MFSPGFSHLFNLPHGGSACGLWWHTLGWIILASQSGSPDDRAGHDEVGTRFTVLEPFLMLLIKT